MGVLGLRVLVILDLNFYCGVLFSLDFLLSFWIGWVLRFTLSPSFVIRVIE